MVKFISRLALILSFTFFNINYLSAQPLNKKDPFTHQDTLRGSVGVERKWWDVLNYNITVAPNYTNKSISGKTTIKYKIIEAKHVDYLQIDLQQPLMIDTLYYDGKLYINYPAKPYFNEGNVWHIPLPKASLNSIHTLTIAYHGNPRIAVNPPWDGGWIFSKDEKGRPWMTVACQGLGASVWYPCKDYQGDEPDSGATLNIIVPDSLVAVGNGRLTNKKNNRNGTTTWTWNVKSPINNYNIIPYIGKYVNFTDSFEGEKGKLELSYWVLDYDQEKAKYQFGRDVKRMLKAFEYWFGPYPFYEDGYKLVESSHLGMEHQSATAYGNHFKDGYLGRDLSGSGWGLKWDYIIIHESGHEWFGNNITTNDIADMWIHEGFTMYSEVLFIEYYYGKEAADEYLKGIRRNIRNDVPLIGPYGVNKEGSGDMYNKGASLLHTIRQIINNDSIFRNILQGLNKEFYHKTTTSKDVEVYFSKISGKDFSKVFDQYLRTTKIPQLQYQLISVKEKPGQYTLKYKWTNCINGFDMPVKIIIDGNETWLYPGITEQSVFISTGLTNNPPQNTLTVNKNFFINAKKID